MDEGRNAFRGAGLEEAVLEFPPCIRRPMGELAAQNPRLQVTLRRALRDGDSGGVQKLTDAMGLWIWILPRAARSRSEYGRRRHGALQRPLSASMQQTAPTGPWHETYPFASPNSYGKLIR